MAEPFFEQSYPATKRVAAVQAARIVARHRLPSEDRHDLQQEALFEFWLKLHLFDPGRGTRALFAEKVITNRLASLMRRKNAHRRRCSIEVDVDSLADSLPAPNTRIELRMDVRLVLAGLSAFDRTVAIFLAEYTAAETARLLRVARATIYRSINRLRVAFAAAGLGKALERTQLAEGAV